MLSEKELSSELYESYSFNFNKIDEVDYSGERPHLSCEDVLDVHFLICNHFYRLGEKIGGFGPKDFGLLNSAVSRQIMSAGGSFIYEDIWEIASTLIFGLINNHPFYDANKRTAFLSSVFFMLERGFVPRVDIVEIEDFTVDIAEFNRLNGRHMRVEEIAPRFKTMFRKADKSTSYLIKYREMRTILGSFGYELRNPSGNFIDVYKDGSKVYKVAWPGEGREVGRKTLSNLRKALCLTPEYGCDAQVFYKGEDPLNVLIGEYEEPLKRLADR